MTDTVSNKLDANAAWPLWLAGLAGPVPARGARAARLATSRLATSRLVRSIAIASVLAAGVIAATQPPGSVQADPQPAALGAVTRDPQQATALGAVTRDPQHAATLGSTRDPQHAAALGSLTRDLQHAALGSLANRAPMTDLPATLAETGLYSDGHIAADVLAFSPQYPLWSDGASKQRWIYLPSAIDASDANAWVFPVGTRIWKQFSFGARVETRFMMRTAAGWRYATYVWRGDTAVRAPRDGLVVAVATQTHRVPSEGLDATQTHRVPSEGLDVPATQTHRVPSEGLDVVATQTHRVPSEGLDVAVPTQTHRFPSEGLDVAVPTQTHRVPSESDCRACHGNAATPVLGFGALQLSVDRDPLAPHRDLEGLGRHDHGGRVDPHRELAGDVDLIALVIGGYVRNLDDIAPRIAGSPTQRAALGYLHGNCGGCHRAEGPLAGLGMVFAQPDDTLRGTANVTGKFAPLSRIAPGDAAHSLVIQRMQARRTIAQMPPIGTDVVDAEALRLVADWIDQLAPPKH